MLTFFLFVVLEYIVSVIGYIFYYESYAGNCESMLYCFLFTFDQTFKGNSGIGTYLTENDGVANVAKKKLSRFFFDNIATYVLNVIMI